MKILINPKYQSLKGFINSIPVRFEKEGEVIYTGRNLIKVMSYDGLNINIKRYAIPKIFNNIIYSFFRKPKGLRAFTYPQTLLEKGFETPEPIAYIEDRRFGLMGYSFFISVQSPYKQNFYQFGNADIRQCSDVVSEFARYTARLHESGIMHCDYSPGNILFDRIDGEYHFSLVDINRMYFGNVSIEKGCSNFARMWGQIPFFELIAKEYAQARNADEEYCLNRILHYRKKFWKRYTSKHKVIYDLHI